MKDFENDVKIVMESNNICISVDECYFSEKVMPLYGYSQKGSKCILTSPSTGWKKRSLILAVANDGSMCYEIFEGSVNKVKFRSLRLAKAPPMYNS